MSIGYSQADICRCLNVDDSTISRWINSGEVTINSDALQTLTEQMKAGFISKAGELLVVSLEELIREIKAGEIKGRELGIVLGIVADKATNILAQSTINGTSNATQVNINFESVTQASH